MEEKDDFPVVMICGMHRSGTSLVASMCQKLGIHIGSDLMPGHRSNELGHFEDMDFYQLHEEILTDNNLLPSGLEGSDFCLQISDKHLQSATHLIAERVRLGQPWGWKDPRSLLFLSFWKQLIPRIKVICVFRHPAEVAESLFQRGDSQFQDDGEGAYRIWHEYNQVLHKYALENPEDIIIEDLAWIQKNADRFMDRIGSFIGLSHEAHANPFRQELLHQVQRIPRRQTCQGLIRSSHTLYGALQEVAANRRDLIKDEAQARNPSCGTRTAVLIPIYKLPLEDSEMISFQQLRYHLSCYERIIIAPESLDIKTLNLPTCRFNDQFFTSVESYSRLLLEEFFYECFSNYDYILIYQLDSLIFSSNLDSWCESGWDYIGAPWFNGFSSHAASGLWTTGNGGLSLRKVASARRILSRSDVSTFLSSNTIAEDLFWSFEAPRFDPTFRIPPAQLASEFAIEGDPRYMFSFNGNKLPFGCHYWNRTDPDFWLNFIHPMISVRAQGNARTLLNNNHPDSQWFVTWMGKFFSNFVKGAEPLTIARILTNDIPLELISSPPTHEGIQLIFEKLLGRQPGEDWYDYWIGRPDSILLDALRDLSNGEEFRSRCNRVGELLTHSS
ncbi:MAG: DUF5672 family protein [Synechococcaceae cyanobacterium]